ncbi:MAG: VOC family protein [Nocardioides sp.]
MSTYLVPYLNFTGTTRDAMSFYESVFGGQLEIMTYGDMGDPAEMGMPPEAASAVMHSALTTSESVVIYASDLMDPTDVPKNGHVALSGDEHDVLSGWFEALAAGGTIDEPLEKAPWGDYFGQVTDKFEITWLVNIAGGDQG